MFKTLIAVIVSLPIFPAIAQVPFVPSVRQDPSPSIAPSIPPAIDPNNHQNHHQNTGELPDDPNQLRTWVCAMGTDRIAVSAKDVKGWKEMVEKPGWKCTEENTDIPDGALNLSCEPEQTLGILTVYWLGGKNGKKQLTVWKNNLAEKHGMICTFNNVQIFDTQNNIIPNLNR